MNQSQRAKSGDESFTYQAGEELYDEMIAGDGGIRPAWQYVFESLGGMGQRELIERQTKASRILRDDGATYNIYNDDRTDRTWPLDLVPWIIDSSEWLAIEAGLQERAELFNLILSDLYGPREIIARGLLPPEVIFSHKGFLRPCQGLFLPGEHQLIIHSTDLIRRSDGSMCLLADRTQAPSGAGYALENRTVMTRVLPSMFRDSHVHRLASFFRHLRQRLMALAPHVTSPRIVVLTPGAHNETYFEHSYLANYMGLSLVQSSDLVMRNGYIWMKSLDGLSRVDVILRRIDDYFCDQVELKGDSQLGIPGLLEAVRNGNVAIANPLGSGILENPALLRYLPEISAHFLGREPRLKSVSTWWCGDANDMIDVEAKFDDLIIKPIFRGPGAHSVEVSSLGKDKRATLLNAIRLNPHLFVAQEKIMPSHIPVLKNGNLKPCPVILRTFSVASEGAYRVMPGGLTRVGQEARTTLISNQGGALSKDTWVLASEPEKQTSLWTQERLQQPVGQESSALPSRVVENLFWMGRYAERAENGLRLMRTVFLQTNGAIAIPRTVRDILLKGVTQLTATAPGFIGDPKLLDKFEPELLSVITDSNRVGSISHCIYAMLNSAEESKELLSADTHRVINDIRDQLEALDENLRHSLVSAPEEVLDPLVSSLLSLSGIVQESMIRGMGWRFIDMGRRLERAMQTVSLCRAILIDQLGELEESVALESLLMTIEALISYRRRYRASLDVRDVLELILVDTTNPRSLLYQLEQLEMHLAELPTPIDSGRELESEERCVLEAISKIKLNRMIDLANADKDKKRNDLDQVFARISYLLGETSNHISRKFFDHSVGPQQLVRQTWSLE
jgi:uncharacterized circularly permuted ATP-grasp superfamily protein/uncharacterized alpha-E superfamily protein